VRSKRTTLNATGMQALFAVHHCGKNAQAGLDSLTIGQLSVSRGGPSIERAVPASRGRPCRARRCCGGFTPESVRLAGMHGAQCGDDQPSNLDDGRGHFSNHSAPGSE
jgi:hypothetical protein